MKTELNVRGMHCNSCKNLIEEDLAELPGVKEVSVDFAKGHAQIEHDPDKAPVALLIEKIQALGYQAEAA